MSWWDVDLFWPLLIISQLSGFGVVIIISYWIAEYLPGPFKWEHDIGIISYHSFMLTLGMVFLFGEAMLLFPVPKRLHLKSHFWRKVMHGCTQTAAVIFTIVGIKAIFWEKRRAGYPRFYSVHAWVGMASSMMFFLQQGVAIFYYVLARFFGSRSPSSRFMVRFTSMHTFFGFVLFAMAIASCLTGMGRWIELFVPNYYSRPTSALLGDIYALLMLLFGIVVAFLATRPAVVTSSRKKSPANGDASVKEKSTQQDNDGYVDTGV